MICYGTRPEYIKISSLITNIQGFKTCYVKQHLELLSKELMIQPTYTIDVDNTYSTNRLNNIISTIMKHVYIFENIDWVLVQGDTTTALGIALSAFNNRIKIIHLEAGIRSHDINSPFPEEANRQIISRIANIHLCPTEMSKMNLIKENILENIYVVGNTVLDGIDKTDCEYGNFVVITIHRRDNIPNITEWFENIECVSKMYSDVEFIFISHPNPDITKHLNLFKKVRVMDHVSREIMIQMLKKCAYVITDSGGIQEESLFLNKKVIVCRDRCDRKEILNGCGYLCTKPEELTDCVGIMASNYVIENQITCPFGDGKSWIKIKEILERL